MHTKRAFTLLELLIVVIILGILASLGAVQYTKVMEKGRSAEARANLGVLRKAQMLYYEEYGAYIPNVAAIESLGTNLPLGIGFKCTNSKYYYQYICFTEGNSRAYRCESGGKTPNSATGYTLKLNIDGQFSCPAGDCP